MHQLIKEETIVVSFWGCRFYWAYSTAGLFTCLQSLCWDCHAWN